MINQEFKAKGSKYEVLSNFGNCRRELGGSELRVLAQFLLCLQIKISLQCLKFEKFEKRFIILFSNNIILLAFLNLSTPKYDVKALSFNAKSIFTWGFEENWIELIFTENKKNNCFWSNHLLWLSYATNQQPFDRLTQNKSQALIWSLFYATTYKTGQLRSCLLHSTLTKRFNVVGYPEVLATRRYRQNAVRFTNPCKCLFHKFNMFAPLKMCTVVWQCLVQCLRDSIYVVGKNRVDCRKGKLSYLSAIKYFNCLDLLVHLNYNNLEFTVYTSFQNLPSLWVWTL